jgi:multiple sugar transport system substrate-binding protein
MKTTWGIAVCASLVLLGSCGPKKVEETNAPPQQAPSTSRPEAGRKVEISLWTGPSVRLVEGKEAFTRDYGDYEKWVAQQFMQEHPEVRVTVQLLTWEDLPKKVPAAVAAGDPPTLLIDYLGRTSGLAYQDVLEPLEELVPAEELADYQPDYLEMFTIRGHLHALPMFCWASHLVGNRALWKAAGAEELLPSLEDPNWTFDQFYQALQAVARPNACWPLGLQVSSEQGDYDYLAYFWGYGAKLYENRDYTHVALNSQAGVQALEFLVKLADEGLIEPGATTIQGNDLENLFWQHQTAITASSLRIWNDLKAARAENRVREPMELFLAHFPHAEGVTNGLAVGPTGVCVFKQEDPEKRKWAVELARYLNTPERQRELCANGGWFPTRKSTPDPHPNDPYYRAVQKLIRERGIEDMGLTSPHYYQVRVLLYPQIQAALLHKKTPAQALADYEKAANRVLAGK